MIWNERNARSLLEEKSDNAVALHLALQEAVEEIARLRGMVQVLGDKPSLSGKCFQCSQPASKLDQRGFCSQKCSQAALLDCYRAAP